MDIGADEGGGLTDDLAHLHIVAHLHHGLGRGAGMLGQGDHHDVGLGEAQQGLVLAELLLLGGMDAAVVTGEAALPDGLHIVVDDLEIDLAVITKLDGLALELPETALLAETLVDLLPGAVLVGVHFALAVLGAAALTVHQALGAVHDGTDAAGHVQIALSAGVAALLGQGHAVMAAVIEGIGRRIDGQIHHACDGLDAQAAGDHEDAFRSLGDQVLQLLFRLGLVAEEVHLDGARDGLALGFGQFHEFAAVRFVHRLKLFEALVTSHDEDLVRFGQERRKLVDLFQPVLGIVLQFLTFLKNDRPR